MIIAHYLCYSPRKNDSAPHNAGDVAHKYVLEFRGDVLAHLQAEGEIEKKVWTQIGGISELLHEMWRRNVAGENVAVAV